MLNQIKQPREFYLILFIFYFFSNKNYSFNRKMFIKIPKELKKKKLFLA